MEVKTKGKDLNSEANKSNDKENIRLIGFSLEPVDMIVVKKIVGNYAKKISKNVTYQELKINLKQTQKNKSFLHEINVKVRAGGNVLVASSTNNNLYAALSEALDKVFEQASNKN